MKAQFIYENMNFERGKDTRHSIGIGKRALIDKWFKKWAPDAKYIVNKDLHISVKRSLYLNYAPITSLPDNLTIEGALYLSGTLITSLPDNLNSKGGLYIRDTEITSLPDNLSVGLNLDIRNTEITSLPDNLRVGGKIYKDF